MTTIAFKTTAEYTYHMMYEWFADFVWDLFDDTKGNENNISIPTKRLKKTAESSLQYLLKIFFGLLEECIRIILRFVFNVKKLKRKDIQQTIQTYAAWLQQQKKLIIQTIKTSIATAYRPGFDSYFVVNSC